jgi:GTP1/Obg family GTP-binding protein
MVNQIDKEFKRQRREQRKAKREERKKRAAEKRTKREKLDRACRHLLGASLDEIKARYGTRR